MSARRVSQAEAGYFFGDTKGSKEALDFDDRLLLKQESAVVQGLELQSGRTIAVRNAPQPRCFPDGSDHGSLEAKSSSWWVNYLTNL